MSSSPSGARIPQGAQEIGLKEAGEVLPFSYSEAVVKPGRSNLCLPAQPLPGTVESDPLASAPSDSQREAQWRELGRQQAGLECKARFEEQLAGERVGIAKALADFARERGAYYQKIEEECVRLALSIARKVLYREAQVDPLLLMGIVRVALERIEGATGVALLVHPQQAADWRKYLAMRMEPAAMPELVEDPAMLPEQCRLRTSMGTADLGLEIQLREIEQGLMDLLAARPQVKS